MSWTRTDRIGWGFFLVFAAIAVAVTVGGLRHFEQLDPEASASELGAHLDEVLSQSMEEYDIAGVSAGAIRNGQVIWSARMGRAAADGQPVDDHTSFNVGSVSKPLVVWAVLALAQRGSLDLDAPVGRYLRQFELPDSDFDHEEVTVRRLLRHTAGTNKHGYGGYGAHEEQPVDAVELSTTFEPLVVQKEPGRSRTYSGGGYVLLQLMVEDLTGLGFEEALQELVFKPLAMEHSGFEPSLLPTSSAAFAYHGDEIEDLRDVALAAAGAYVSGADMERFVLAHMDGGGVLGRPSLDAAFAPTEPNPSYAMSYSRWETPSGLLLGHGGNNSSWNTQIYVRPETADGFYFLTNSTSGAQLDFELSCAWLSMVESEEGAARCAEAIELTHKISWVACGITLVAAAIAWWLVLAVLGGRRVLSSRPRGRGTLRLVGRMSAFTLVLGALGTAVWLFYTNSMMWRTEIVLIDEMPVDEIGSLTAAVTALLSLLTVVLWSSPVPMERDR